MRPVDRMTNVLMLMLPVRTEYVHVNKDTLSETASVVGRREQLLFWKGEIIILFVSE